MAETLRQIRTLALKELADVRRTHVLAVMTSFMLAASFVSLVVAADANASLRARGVALDAPGALGVLLRSRPSEVLAHYRVEVACRADVLVAALLLVIVGTLGTPFLLKQWQMYHRQACMKNLMTFWSALASYSDQHEGAFPQVEPSGAKSVAGIFVPLLMDNGFLTANANVLCPAQGQRPPV